MHQSPISNAGKPNPRNIQPKSKEKEMQFTGEEVQQIHDCRNQPPQEIVGKRSYCISVGESQLARHRKTLRVC